MPESTRSSQATDPHVWVTVLAGGVGARFWPVSRPSRPKQLLPLASDRPLIVDTMDRARLLAPDERIRILAGAHLSEPFATVLPELAPNAILVEPQARGTGPVLAWAAWLLHRQDPDAIMVSLHADHMIRGDDAFHELLVGAVALARQEDALVTVAVEPTRPETGYGYIELGEAVEVAGDVEAYRVARFIEKPDEMTAAKFLQDGYLWNSGIFVWTAKRFLEEVRGNAPEIAEHLPLLDAEKPDEFFSSVPVAAVDVAIMERSDRVVTIAATFEWDDVGSWESLSRTLDSDEDGNVSLGEAYVMDGTDNIVYGSVEPVVLYGVEGLVVVRTLDATLITTRDKAPGLKAALDRLPPHVRGADSE